MVCDNAITHQTNQLNISIMKTKTTITELSHDDLVDLFSTALSGSNYLEADYTNRSLREDEDCLEDILAKNLLNGDTVVITDWYAEGCVYGNLNHTIDEEDACTHYDVNIKDIIRGLERAADGTFNAGDDEWTEQTKRSARVSFDSFMDEDRCYFDLVRADILMQIILFDEIIYG